MLRADENVGRVASTVTLSDPPCEALTMECGTADGTAVAGNGHGTGDYGSAIGRLPFAPGGALTRPISVQVHDDALEEV